MADLTETERRQIEAGSGRFLEEVQKVAPDLVKAGLAAARDPSFSGAAFIDQYAVTLGQLADTTFSNAAQTLLQEESDPEAVALQSAGVGGPRLGSFVLRAFRKRLCNPDSAANLKGEIEKAKKEHGFDITPTATGISTGAATAVAIAIGSLITGPLAVVLAPLAGAVALLLLLVGVDTFCGWAGSKEGEPGEGAAATR
jgi:hypothetical protein